MRYRPLEQPRPSTARRAAHSVASRTGRPAAHHPASACDAGGVALRGAPKSSAGRRTVTVPQAMQADLARHLAEYGWSESRRPCVHDAARWSHESGNFNPATNWKKNVAAIGVPNLHFYDLRHTGNTLAAATGSSLRDLMTRMGHDSPRAAMIYPTRHQRSRPTDRRWAESAYRTASHGVVA